MLFAKKTGFTVVACHKGQAQIKLLLKKQDCSLIRVLPIFFSYSDQHFEKYSPDIPQITQKQKGSVFEILEQK